MQTYPSMSLSARSAALLAGLALLTSAALVGLPTVASAQTVTFQERLGPVKGWRWAEQSTWTTTGHNTIVVGGVKVQDKDVDRLSNWAGTVSILGTDQGKVTGLGVDFSEVLTRDGDDVDSLELDGVTVLIEGPGGDRTFQREDGSRLKRAQKKWLERAFAGESDDDDRGDPLALLLPGKPVSVGESWDLPMDEIEQFIDPERFSLDRSQSRATATMQEVKELGGYPAGVIAYDVLLVPSSMENAEFTLAQLTVTGTATLPLAGNVPWSELDAHTTIRFVGLFKRGGIRAQADIDLKIHGRGTKSEPPPGSTISAPAK